VLIEWVSTLCWTLSILWSLFHIYDIWEVLFISQTSLVDQLTFWETACCISYEISDTCWGQSWTVPINYEHCNLDQCSGHGLLPKFIRKEIWKLDLLASSDAVERCTYCSLHPLERAIASVSALAWANFCCWLTVNVYDTRSPHCGSFGSYRSYWHFLYSWNSVFPCAYPPIYLHKTFKNDLDSGFCCGK